MPRDPADPRPRERERDDTPLRLVVAYKLARGSATLVLAAIATVAMGLGEAPRLELWAEGLREHAVGATSVALGTLLAAASTPAHLWSLVAALAFDGALTTLEGWALHRRWPKAPWLVVVTTGSLVPWETWELARHTTLGRLALLSANVAVVVLLARRIARGTRPP